MSCNKSLLKVLKIFIGLQTLSPNFLEKSFNSLPQYLRSSKKKNKFHFSHHPEGCWKSIKVKHNVNVMAASVNLITASVSTCNNTHLHIQSSKKMLVILTVHSYLFFPFLNNFSHRIAELFVLLFYPIKLIFFKNI